MEQYIQSPKTFTYNAGGEKMRTDYYINPLPNMVPQLNGGTGTNGNANLQHIRVDYCGNLVYENDTLKQVLIDGGYVTFNGTTPQYHFYIQDHLGNNRVVCNASGTIEQVNHYYPFGGLMGESTNDEVQRYKYNGKELDRMHGLNLYDYHARQYDGAAILFTSMDSKCENYYHISPYAYCMGNPVMYVDPDGDSIRVAKEYQEEFKQTLGIAFGESNVSRFGFNSNGNLQINGNAQLPDKSSKKLLNGLKKVMDDKTITNIVYANEYNNGIVNISTNELARCGGACTCLASDNSGNVDNYIIVDPNSSPELKTMIVTSAYYDCEGNPQNANKGEVLFLKQKFWTNTTDRLFHEIGHVIYDGRPQNLVIDYNNYLRRIIGLPQRKYDEKHNRLIR